jgi:hypothetical protein
VDDSEPHDSDAATTVPIEEMPAVQSGFDLAVGQNVLAAVHGGWRDAVVAHRGRTSVMVEYRLDGTPLGARRRALSRYCTGRFTVECTLAPGWGVGDVDRST